MFQCSYSLLMLNWILMQKWELFCLMALLRSWLRGGGEKEDPQLLVKRMQRSAERKGASCGNFLVLSSAELVAGQ